jgi:predicted lysophospholipase L1 biosynthesis ABC-type transport system permease subunit
MVKFVAFRLFRKSILMVLREKKQFTVFCLMYTILIFWTSYSIELVMRDPGLGFASTSFFIALGVGIFLSLLYSWIIVRRNSKTIATLKCIGWTNRDLNSLISGFILFTTIMGFIIVIEVLFHYAAIASYLQASPSTLVSLLPAFATFLIFLFFQILAILVANRKVLKVRPIIALKRVGE